MAFKSCMANLKVKLDVTNFVRPHNFVFYRADYKESTMCLHVLLALCMYCL